MPPPGTMIGSPKAVHIPPELTGETNAQTHLSRRYVLNLDLKDFFPTITQNRVEGMLRALGVDRRVAEIIGRICCCGNHLPQGAPTSPVLSNMVCFRLDRVLMLIATDARSLYTRYADDITFSSFQPPAPLFEGAVPPTGRFSSDLLSARLRDALPVNGFALNPEKAHYADRHSRRIVTGLKINELVNVDRRFVRNLRAAIHSVETLGLDAAQDKFRDQHGGRVSLALHLRGKISWLTSIKGQTDPVVRGLEHSIASTEYFELAHSVRRVAIGDVLTAVGYPGYGPGDKLNVRPGEVTSLPVKGGLQMIEVQQKIAQGMSGGPLLDVNHAVTGINHKGGPDEARDFAVHIRMLDDWLGGQRVFRQSPVYRNGGTSNPAIMGSGWKIRFRAARLCPEVARFGRLRRTRRPPMACAFH